MKHTRSALQRSHWCPLEPPSAPSSPLSPTPLGEPSLAHVCAPNWSVHDVGDPRQPDLRMGGGGDGLGGGGDLGGGGGDRTLAGGGGSVSEVAAARGERGGERGAGG